MCPGIRDTYFLQVLPLAGAISNDPVSTDVNICGAKEKDVDVPVKLQDGEEVGLAVT